MACTAWGKCGAWSASHAGSNICKLGACWEQHGGQTRCCKTRCSTDTRAWRPSPKQGGCHDSCATAIPSGSTRDPVWRTCIHDNAWQHHPAHRSVGLCSRQTAGQLGCQGPRQQCRERDAKQFTATASGSKLAWSAVNISATSQPEAASKTSGGHLLPSHITKAALAWLAGQPSRHAATYTAGMGAGRAPT